jgi:hypothetical protein
MGGFTSKYMTKRKSNLNTIDLLRRREWRAAVIPAIVAISLVLAAAFGRQSAEAAAGWALSFLPGTGSHAGKTIQADLTVSGNGNHIEFNNGDLSFATPNPTAASGTHIPTSTPASFTPTPLIAPATGIPPTPSPACGITDPPPHAIVAGAFSIQGVCAAFAPGSVFMIVRNLHADVNTGGPGPWWIQCPTEIHESGDFTCSGFVCIPDAEYEIAIVFPLPGSLEPYTDWLDKHSTESKYDLPGDYNLVGPSLILRASSATQSPPAQCGRPLAAIDK